MRYTVTEGVAFFEGNVPSAQIIRPIETSMDSLFRESQLKSLESLKLVMARIAKNLGGNCIIQFEYGQKQSSFWKSLFSMDDIYWRGKGIVAIVNPDTIE